MGMHAHACMCVGVCEHVCVCVGMYFSLVRGRGGDGGRV